MSTDDPNPLIPDPKPLTPDPKPPAPVPTQWQKLLADELLRLVMSCPRSDNKPAKPRFSSKGTPCARSWDDEWAAKVEAAEQRLDRRICGARTPAAEPCELAPNHKNGRCRFHGGFPLTGGQQNNRNAAIHGLYSRRLRVCDATCPQWNACPCAGPDLENVPLANRPTCPYEQTEYNTALTDALDRVSRNPNHDALDLHLAHNLALLQVMLNRAAVAMRNASLVDDTVASTEVYQMKSSKPSAHLEAFTRIAREYRHFAAMIKAPEPVEPDLNEFLNHTGRALVDSGLDPANDQSLHPESTFDMSHQARRYMREAVKHAAAGKDTAAVYAATDAMQIAPIMFDAAEWKDRVLEAYRPKGAPLPKEAVKKIMTYILKLDPDEQPPEEDPLARYIKEQERRYRERNSQAEPAGLL
jgi:hypothetical protein